ncbi:MAG: hypothetical protein RIM99_10550 [Cyclobacteriaceae bacterium]
MKEFIKYVLPYFILAAFAFILARQNIDASYLIPAFPLLAIYYFIIDNPYKKHQIIITILFIAWIIALILRLEGIAGDQLPNVIILLLAIIYGLRFFSREEKLAVDYLKLLGVLVYAVVTIIRFESGSFVIPFLLFIYLLDRLIIRRKMSKTLQIILFSFMGLVMITFILYGQIKSAEADMAREQAVANFNMAKAAQEEAESQAQKARKMVQQAESQLIKLKAELTECQSK